MKKMEPKENRTEEKNKSVEFNILMFSYVEKKPHVKWKYEKMCIFFSSTKPTNNSHTLLNWNLILEIT